MPFKIKDSLQVGTVVDITSSGIVTNAAFAVADGTNGFLKKTGVNTWSVDTNTYLTTAVTSVALSLPSEITITGSPVTTTGTLSGSWASQTQKTFFSAPNATNGTPSFRAILASDIPTLNQSTTGAAGSVANSLTINNSGTGAASPATFNGSAAVTISYNTVGAAPLSHTHGSINNSGQIGSTSGLLVITTTNGALTTLSAAGTPSTQFLKGDNSWTTAVTSVATTGNVNGITLSGTVTTTGTLTLGGTLSVSGADFGSQTAKYALIAPNGASGNPTFRQVRFDDLTATPTTVSGYGITDAYTKTEVDGLVTGLDFKQSARVATTANITLSGTQTIDGVSVVAGNRVLVKDQSTASQNGIYVVAAGAWSRSTDADNTPAGEVTAGMYCFVEEGTVNADSGWVLITNDTITLGSTSLTFAQFNGLGQITAGTGLSKTGNTLNHSNSVTGATIAEGGISRTLAYGGVFNVPSVTYDNQGHVTSTTSVALTLPANTNEFGTAAIGTDSGYTWGSANTNTNQVADSIGDTLTFVAGTGVNLYTNTVAGTDAIKIGHSNSVTGATIAEGGANRTLAFGGTFNVPSVTYDNQGHVTSTSTVTLTLPATPSGVNDFGNVSIATDSGYTWGVANTNTTQTADTTSDTLTIVAGTGVNLYTSTVAGTDAIKIGHSNSVTGATIAEGGANRTLAYSGVFNVPSVTYDNQGHVTSTTSVALTLPAGAALGYTTAASSGTVTCTTGANATLPAATTSLAGLMVAADKTKLDASTASATNSTIVLRDGSGNFAANIITAEGVNLDATIQKTYATATVATVAETVVDSWAGATYRTCKYLVQIAQGTNYQSSEILVVHNGTTTSMTEYAVIETNGSLATFTSDYSGGNARLKVTMGSATSAAFKIDKTLIVV